MVPRYGLRFPFPSRRKELNIAGLKYGWIYVELRKTTVEIARANVFVAICFRAVSDFRKKEDPTSVVRFSDRRRSISRQIEFFRRSKNAVYNRYDEVEGNIRPLGLWNGRFSFMRRATRLVDAPEGYERRQNRSSRRSYPDYLVEEHTHGLVCGT